MTRRHRKSGPRKLPDDGQDHGYAKTKLLAVVKIITESAELGGDPVRHTRHTPSSCPQSGATHRAARPPWSIGPKRTAPPSAAPADPSTNRAREADPDAKASQRETIEAFVAALLRGSRFDDTGRGEQMRRWVKRSAQAFLAGERIYAAPEIKVQRKKPAGSKPATGTTC